MAISDEIKARLDIVDVVGEHVSLKKSGRSFRALCPFHAERTPSFFVFPETQTWRCFGACATGGDLFAFVMKKEGIGFGEVLRTLAQQAGVSLSTARQRQEQQDPLLRANQEAARFFAEALASPDGQRAMAYLLGRGLRPETVQRFELGFSRPDGSSLRRHLEALGFSGDVLVNAGLVTRREDGQLADLFRGRIMFPIWDESGRLAGFGGRVLDRGEPKYLNSPRTPLFDKGGMLYALDKAKDGIKGEGVAVVVEGYMDAIAAHQHGFTNVVASMGTALTPQQVALLQGVASQVALALDPDAAGQEATFRSLESSWRVFERRATATGRRGPTLYERAKRPELRIAALPAGKDPDEVISANPEAWRQLISAATPMLDYLFGVVAKRYDLSAPQGKQETAERLFPLIAAMENAFEQDHYFQKLARLLGVSPALLEASVGRPRPGAARGKTPVKAAASPMSAAERQPLEEYTLALLIRYPDLRAAASPLHEEHFQWPENRAVFAAWRDRSIMEELRSSLDEQFQDHLNQLISQELPPTDARKRPADFAQCLRRLEERRLRELQRQEEYILSELEREGGEVEGIQKQILETNAQLKQLFLQSAGRTPRISRR